MCFSFNKDVSYVYKEYNVNLWERERERKKRKRDDRKKEDEGMERERKIGRMGKKGGRKTEKEWRKEGEGEGGRKEKEKISGRERSRGEGRKEETALTWSERRLILASYCSQQPELTWTIHDVHILSPDTGRNMACWMMALIRELFPAPVLPNNPM